MNERTNLLHDDRGAIMVVMLFMTTFLIGACWYVFGIGDAVAYRENLQNAADATAFAAAVYDARGMNLIAMINLIMAAIMAILVAAKCAQLVLLGVNLISCACAAFVVTCPVCCPICAGTTEAEPEMEEFVDGTIAEPVMIAEKILHYTETGIAIVWPWLAEGKSTMASLDYQPGVVFGTTWATAQVPVSLNNLGDWTGLITGSFSFKNLFGGGGKLLSLGNFLKQFSGKGLDGWFTGRLGLPVQNGTLNDLCSMAGRDVFDVVSLPLSILTVIPGIGQFIDMVINAVKDAVKWMTGNFAFYFCKDSFTGAWDIIKNILGWGSGPNPLNITDDTVPKRLYTNAYMGDQNFAIWSNAVGAWNEYHGAGVQVAGLIPSGVQVGGAPPDAMLGVAKAEFYYEPQSGDTMAQEVSTTGLFGIISDRNCMWNMRWRARLRRYVPEGSNFMYGLEKTIQGLINGMLGQLMQGLPGLTNNPTLKKILQIWGQNSGTGQSGYSNTCQPPSSNGGTILPQNPLQWLKEIVNPLCIPYAISNWLTNPQSPNPTGPAPGIYH